MIIYNGIPFGSATKETLLELQIKNMEDENNECVCGTVNCESEYSCHTSGW
tara:strand:+ start:4282 stop:4434 length:153 start_codon:yes stop_codon:yes gene_type:complete